MTMRMICDACRNPIASGDLFRELAASDDVEGQRHYHNTTEKPCWTAIKDGIRNAEQAVRNPPAP